MESAYFDWLAARQHRSSWQFRLSQRRGVCGARAEPPFIQQTINGISYGSALTNIHTLNVPAITALQEEYVRRVVDSVNDFNNVLYEIANEPSATYATPWQYHMIQFIKQYEGTKPKQHPVGMTYQSDGTNSTLLNSGADWISPGLEGGYESSPPANSGTKVIFNDTDHLGGSSVGDRGWVWKSFMRGLNTLFMDRYDLPWSITDGPIAKATEIRNAMGNTLAYSRRIDLAHATPNVSISSTGYALANTSECLVYSPSSSSFTVNLQSYSGPMQVEWFNPATQQTTLGGTVTGGVTRTFQPLSGSDAVLYLHGNVTGVETAESPLSRPGLRASPNPSSGRIQFIGHSGSATGSRGTLRVFDVAGRLVFGEITVFGNRFQSRGWPDFLRWTPFLWHLRRKGHNWRRNLDHQACAGKVDPRHPRKILARPLANPTPSLYASSRALMLSFFIVRIAPSLYDVFASCPSSFLPDGGNDLPGQPPSLSQPRSRLAAFGELLQNLSISCCVSQFTMNGNRLGEFEVRPAVQCQEFLAIELEGHGHDRPLRPS
jgi:hypothetical protein